MYRFPLGVLIDNKSTDLFNDELLFVIRLDSFVSDENWMLTHSQTNCTGKVFGV